MNKYRKEVLSNGVPLYLVPIKGAKTATILFMFKTGSRYETRENNGISHFLEHLFFKGTKSRPNTINLAGELDSLGCEFNAFTAKEYTGYWIRIAQEKIKYSLDILGDMLLNSKFEAEEIEREKGVIIEELNMYEDNPMMHIEDVLESCLYGDTPAGWETVGTKKNIQNFKREDFIKYFKSQYGAKSLQVILAGGVSQKDKLMTEKLLLEFPKNNWRNKKKVIEKQKSPQLLVVNKKNDQLNLSLAVRAHAIGHKEEFVVKLLSIILGGAMSSRLFIRLRERNGLAYYVKTSTEFHSDSGYLTTQAGVPLEKTEQAIRIILEEYTRLTKEIVSDKELKRAKDLLKGRVLLQMETSDNIATWYARQAVLRNKVLTPGDFLREINKIKPVDLQKVAKNIFVNSGLNLAMIGQVKADKFKKLLKF